MADSSSDNLEIDYASYISFGHHSGSPDATGTIDGVMFNYPENPTAGSNANSRFHGQMRNMKVFWNTYTPIDIYTKVDGNWGTNGASATIANSDALFRLNGL